MKVDHFAFFVSDMDKAIEFYCKVLGMKLLSRDVDEAHNEEFSFLELEGGNLELLSTLKKEKAIENKLRSENILKKQLNCPHLAIRAHNLEDIVKKCEENNITIIGGPFIIKRKVKWMYISDIDGNILEFVKWL
ncbi:MAG: hypothetical protein GF364_16300 [Candidatus Lokiarchaeota archaeon]|nr:hypothetical protein [Candidatus Lokiarchaeota archaeon]